MEENKELIRDLKQVIAGYVEDGMDPDELMSHFGGLFLYMSCLLEIPEITILRLVSTSYAYYEDACDIPEESLN